MNVHEAKSQLSRLLARVQAGERVWIAKAGAPVAELVAWRERPGSLRNPGSWAGNLAVQEPFNRPLP